MAVVTRGGEPSVSVIMDIVADAVGEGGGGCILPLDMRLPLV